MVLAPQAPASRSENFNNTEDLKSMKARVEILLQEAEIPATISYGPDAVLIHALGEYKERIRDLLNKAGIEKGVKL